MTGVPALWVKHRGLALAIARDFYLPGSERQDVEQEALIALWQACRDHDDSKGSFPMWARVVIKTHLTDCLRRATRGKHGPLNKARPLAHRLPCLHQVTDKVEDREQLRLVLHAIEHDLTPVERHCVMGIAAGKTYAEIGRAVGDAKAVDNALMRARSKLRQAA